MKRIWNNFLNIENFWWRKRRAIVQRYGNEGVLDWKRITDMDEEFLMSLDDRLPFDEDDISEGKFPYGIQKDQKDIVPARLRNFCAGPLIKFCGLMYVLTGKEDYLTLAKKKMDEIIKAKDSVFANPVSTAWAFNQGAATLFYLTRERRYTDLVKEASSEIVKRHFEKMVGYFKSRTGDFKQTQIFSTDLYGV